MGNPTALRFCELCRHVSCSLRVYRSCVAAKKYHAFLSSHTLIKQIPRLLGPGLNRAGKFPSLVSQTDNLAEKIEVRGCVCRCRRLV